MEWHDVKDPHDEFILRLEGTHVTESYTPAEIQTLINEQSVIGMVHEVNSHFKSSRLKKPALLITRVNGMKAVTGRSEGLETEF